MLASAQFMLVQFVLCLIVVAPALELPTVRRTVHQKPDVWIDHGDKGSVPDEPRKQEESISGDAMTKYQDYDDDLFIDDDDPPDSRTVDGMLNDASPTMGSGMGAVLSSRVVPTSSPSALTFLDAELPASYNDDSIAELGSGTPTSGGTKCQLLRDRALAGIQVFYTPECDENGNYKPLQCKDDQCWCADADGRVIPYTRQRVTDTPPDCARKTGADRKKYSNKNPPTKTVEILTTLTTKTTTPTPTMGQQTASSWLFLRTDILAGIFVGTGVGFICAVVLVICIVHRMKKKDEGSYALDEPRRPLPCQQPYERAPTKEVYA